MDDPRIEYLRDSVYLALEIKEEGVFDSMLNRDDGQEERMIAKFLNDTLEDAETAILFYKIVEEEEEEYECEIGKIEDCENNYTTL